MPKKLHIVSFDVPYPPNYGGAIDVFYKLKALNELGIHIILHCFEYGRGEQKTLHKYCKEVHYYDRNPFARSFLSKDPFMVKSRSNINLIANLNRDNNPILFEGLHTTHPIISGQLRNKKVYVRAHNIEHNFYKGLAKSESSLFKKRFLKQEAKKLKKYEKILDKVDGIFTISPFEQDYFHNSYGEKSTYIPAFHNHMIETKLQSSEKIVLYHGNISVSENTRAALFLIDVYKDSGIKLLIASSFTNKNVVSEINKYDNIELAEISDADSLNDLFERAHIHVLPTFQKTGIKLKLLNTLYQGRFVIANDFMVEDTGLESLCTIANTSYDFLHHTKLLFEKDYTNKDREERLRILQDFHPQKGAQSMIDVIFK